MQYGYGVNLRKANLNKVLEFLKRFPEDYADYHEDREGKPEDNDSVLEWMEKYDNGLGYSGISAYFADKVNEAERLQLCCEDGCRHVYLPEGLPWDFNHTERHLTKRELDGILARWVNRITDDVLDIDRITIYDD
ncbi:MAG: hypothetical protein LIO92_04820 [Clostridiales bacterium]|nr:hypothetical protein [Clostridiales bacterium]